jgi:hypothetical protein
MKKGKVYGRLVDNWFSKMSVFCRMCRDSIGNPEEIGDDIWEHFHFEHLDIWEPFRSTYENTDARQALRAYLKIKR